MKIRNKFTYGATSTERKDTVSIMIQMAADKALKCSPIDFGVPWMGGSRAEFEQFEIFKKGWSKCDGYKITSYHQKKDDSGRGLAIDLVPWINGKFEYKAIGHFGIIGMLMLESWEELQDQALIPKDKYLHWGGFWSHSDPIKLGWDMAHYEIRDYPQKERI